MQICAIIMRLTVESGINISGVLCTETLLPAMWLIRMNISLHCIRWFKQQSNKIVAMFSLDIKKYVLLYEHLTWRKK